ncbi:MAG: BamA/TamA family outer membrane protein [Candidatus Kapabacteria bacterium]|nr:BamA/TamA family outer membrane protein [Ignavibacteriota bacterium]MCW5883796.1 BamA/TamA family outer membrane protein [Candidatus Kapabacteria bacterium]
MTNIQYILILLLLSVIFPILTTSLYSQNFISDSLYQARRDKFLNEVGDIIFSGNSSFTPNELIDAVNSKKNSMSIQHHLFEYYLDNFKKIPETPDAIKESLIAALKNLSHEIKYFNETTAEMDVQTLWHYYNTNGFHFAKVSYSFYPDFEDKHNVLKFNIIENQRFSIDTLVYIGLDSIDESTLKKINAVKKISKGLPYSEQQIVDEVNIVLNLLLNNGYYYAALEVEPVFINTETISDSITVIFNPGKRQRITKLDFVDSLNNQNIVVRNMKMLQIDIKEGDWYNRSRVQSSINNLHTLGTFNLVSIDTSSVFMPFTDSTLSMLVYTQYRKQKEWGVGMFVNNTQIDNFTNVGVEANIMHRNWGGAAQSGNIFANARLRNISRFLAGQAGEFEGQIGFRIAQPLVWSIENMRIGATGSFYYSLSTVDRLFNISSWYLPIRFPIQLTNETYLNQIIIDFNFEFQNPVNFVDVVRDFENQDNPANDNQTETARLVQALLLYQNLYDYLNGPGITLLTSNVFGLSLIGDSRNHPFSPNSGDHFFFSMDGWNVFLAHPWISGIAKYLRLQTTYNMFFKTGANAVSAFKFRAGVINLVDDYNAYVPFERQFFAGGANSVRGWLSRELHYSPIESAEYAKVGETSDLVLDTRSYKLISNVLGSSAILEGSVEWRYTFPMPKGIDETFAEQISKIGLTFFVDYGNAYHWYAEGDETNNMIWYEYFTKMAWAAGVGIRYDTPIGPIRLDFGFPVYKPGYNLPDYQIWDDSAIFRDMKFHFGIGHSF